MVNKLFEKKCKKVTKYLPFYVKIGQRVVVICVQPIIFEGYEMQWFEMHICNIYIL